MIKYIRLCIPIKRVGYYKHAALDGAISGASNTSSQQFPPDGDRGSLIDAPYPHRGMREEGEGARKQRGTCVRH